MRLLLYCIFFSFLFASFQCSSLDPILCSHTHTHHTNKHILVRDPAWKEQFLFSFVSSFASLSRAFDRIFFHSSFFSLPNSFCAYSFCFCLSSCLRVIFSFISFSLLFFLHLRRSLALSIVFVCFTHRFPHIRGMLLPSSLISSIPFFLCVHFL